MKFKNHLSAVIILLLPVFLFIGCCSSSSSSTPKSKDDIIKALKLCKTACDSQKLNWHTVLHAAGCDTGFGGFTTPPSVVGLNDTLYIYFGGPYATPAGLFTSSEGCLGEQITAKWTPSGASGPTKGYVAEYTGFGVGVGTTADGTATPYDCRIAIPLTNWTPGTPDGYSAGSTFTLSVGPGMPPK